MAGTIKAKIRYAILRYLGIGDALHATKHCIEKHDAHADHYTQGDIHFEKAREHNPHSAHLPCNIGEGYEQGADNSHEARGLAVITIADEVRYREFAKITQIRGYQQCQQHVATGPAHQVYRAIAPHEGNDAGHGDERSCTHPIGGCGHTVGQRRHMRTGDVELAGRGGACPDGDTDVHQEGKTHAEVGPDLQTHAQFSRRL
jgi:hypothetical protein